MENYEKKYQKLVDAVKVLRDNNPSDEGIQNWVNDNVPELKGTEDGRIKGAIIDHLKDSNLIEWAAWLEKQGESKPIDIVEPKFHKGDWVVDNCGNVWKIEGILNQFYILECVEGGESRPTIEWVDKTFHLWTIQDAKDGDVLVHSSFMFDDFVFIYNSTSILQAYCYYSGEKKRFIIEDRGHYCNWNMQEVKPATKEQRDLLFQKMKEAGYEWNAEKKEVKKINSYCQEHCKGYQETGKCFVDGECQAKKDAESAWSEDDENMLKSIIATCELAEQDRDSSPARHLFEMQTNWLKSLKERMKGE